MRKRAFAPGIPSSPGDFETHVLEAHEIHIHDLCAYFVGQIQFADRHL